MEPKSPIELCKHTIMHLMLNHRSNLLINFILLLVTDGRKSAKVSKATLANIWFYKPGVVQQINPLRVQIPMKCKTPRFDGVTPRNYLRPSVKFDFVMELELDPGSSNEG